jgi:hypothetical protein
MDLAPTTDVQPAGLAIPTVSRKLNQIEAHFVTASVRISDVARTCCSSQTRSLAALAFHHPVALLQQALALAILAFLLLFDVGAFVVGHFVLPVSERMIASERQPSR